MKKKILSLLLSLALIFTALPFTHIHIYAETCADGIHTFSDWTTETAATCESTGTQSRTCETCGYVESGMIEATGHSMTYNRKVKPSCYENGYIEKICKNEGCSHTEQIILEPDGHHAFYETTEVIVEATEEQFGIIKGYCGACQTTVYEAIQKVGVTVIKLGCLQSAHRYKEVVITDSVGHEYTVKYCTRCKDYGAVSVPTCEVHDFSEWVITCPANIKFRHCEFCGYEETVELEMTEHSLIVTSSSEASCVVEGYIHYSCTYCGKDYTVITPKKDHTFEIINTIESTCFEHGYNELCCTICGYMEKSEYFPLDPNKHEYSYEIIQRPTCLTQGEVKYACDLCNDTYTETLDITSHNWSDWEVQNATCTAAGYECRECIVCGKREEFTIPQMDHKEVIWTTTVSPTCVETGYREGHCAECGTYVYETLYTTGGDHNIDWFYIESATCIREGVKEGVCYGCGLSFTKVLPIDENAHTFNMEGINYEPTCSHEGEKVLQCSDCFEIKIEVIPIVATNHVWSNWEIKVEPDCVAEGVEYRYCQECFVEEERIAEPTGEHIYTSIIEKTVNCEDGIDMYEVCECCGYEKYVGTRFPKSHIYDDWCIVISPQLGVKGEKTRTCIVCGHVEHIELPALADIDGDGIVTKDDYNDVLDAVNLNSTLTDDEKLVADVNGDGAVDAFDAIYIDLLMNSNV